MTCGGPWMAAGGGAPAGRGGVSVRSAMYWRGKSGHGRETYPSRRASAATGCTSISPASATRRPRGIPLATHDAVREGVLSASTRVFTPGFGAGAVAGVRGAAHRPGRRRAGADQAAAGDGTPARFWRRPSVADARRRGGPQARPSAGRRVACLERRALPRIARGRSVSPPPPRSRGRARRPAAAGLVGTTETGRGHWRLVGATAGVSQGSHPSRRRIGPRSR